MGFDLYDEQSLGLEEEGFSSKVLKIEATALKGFGGRSGLGERIDPDLDFFILSIYS